MLEGGAVAAALLLGAMAFLVTADVLGRNLGLGVIPWILDASEYSLPLATFLAAPWLLHQNEHVRLDLLLHALPARAARALDRAASGMGLAVCLVLVLYGARTAVDSARQGALVMKTLVFPEWWLYAPVAPCFALLAIEFARRLGGPAIAAGTGPRA